MGKMIKIKAFKYPDIIHYEWQGQIFKQTADYILVLCHPGRTLIHHTKDQIFTFNDLSLEIYPLKEWYTAAMVIEEGKISSYYCNIATPPALKNNDIHFIDLDIDLVREKNQDWQVTDMDEFQLNSKRYQYPLKLKEDALNSLSRLKNKVKNKVFPFNHFADDIAFNIEDVR